MTLEDHQPFLQAIVNDADSDDPRLVYADWLDERQDPRGEFIRIQCQLHQLVPAGREFDSLCARSEQMLAEYGMQWVGELVGETRYLPEFSRGFVKILDIRAARFAEHRDSLARVSPYQWVRLTHLNTQFDQWVGSGVLHNVTGLDLSGIKMLPNQLEEILAAAPNLKRFKLSYSRVGFDARLAKVVAKSPCFPNLKCLSIKSNSVGDDFFPAIAEAGGFQNLQVLKFGQVRKGVSLEGVSSETFPMLRDVSAIMNVRISEMEILAQLPGLRSLKIKYAKIADRGIQKLIDGGCTAGLEQIVFSETDTSRKGMMALLGSDLSCCRFLDFCGGNAKLTADCWRTLAENPTVKRLEELKIYHEQLNDDDRAILKGLPIREVESFYR